MLHPCASRGGTTGPCDSDGERRLVGDDPRRFRRSTRLRVRVEGYPRAAGIRARDARHLEGSHGPRAGRPGRRRAKAGRAARSGTAWGSERLDHRPDLPGALAPLSSRLRGARESARATSMGVRLACSHESVLTPGPLVWPSCVLLDISLREVDSRRLLRFPSSERTAHGPRLDLNLLHPTLNPWVPACRDGPGGAHALGPSRSCTWSTRWVSPPPCAAIFFFFSAVACGVTRNEKGLEAR